MLFAPGPVEMEEEICRVAAMPSLPYFRGAEFAEIVKSVSQDVKYLLQTGSTPLPVTASGTGLMEMSVVNLLDPGDTAVVINGGAFGQKWVDICEAYGVRTIECKAELGRDPDLNQLSDLITSQVKAVLINMHETSTGHLYDISAISSLISQSDALFVVDGVSSIGADPFEMDAWGIDCAFVSTQKALALLPGLGYIAFSERALERMSRITRQRYYFDVRPYLLNMPRGMTPFTPAMACILQMQKRMMQIKTIGLEQWIQKHTALASFFRLRLLETSSEFAIFPDRSSNALTSVRLPDDIPSEDVIAYLRDRYNWWFAPAPTRMASKYLRVSHMGNVDGKTMGEVVTKLAEAIGALHSRGERV